MTIYSNKDEWIEHLMEEYYSKVLGYISQHTKSREDAEDLTQDVFTNCVRYQNNYDPEKSPEGAWVFMIAKNILKNYYRGQRDESSIDAMENPDAIMTCDPMGDYAKMLEQRDEIYQALKKLDERTRTIIILRFWGEKSHDEIAEAIGMNVSSVRSAFSRGMKKLETILK